MKKNFIVFICIVAVSFLIGNIKSLTLNIKKMQYKNTKIGNLKNGIPSTNGKIEYPLISMMGSMPNQGSGTGTGEGKV